MITDGRKEERSRLAILEDLAVDGLLEADQLGPNDLLGRCRVLRQAVEHQGDQLGHVQDCELSQEMRVHGADVLQKDHLRKH